MSKMYKCVECDCNFVSTDTDPETLCKWCMNQSSDRVKVSELEKKINVAISILEMVEDNTKMPHKHSDFQVRLHCLAERAREALEIIQEDK